MSTDTAPSWWRNRTWQWVAVAVAVVGVVLAVVLTRPASGSPTDAATGPAPSATTSPSAGASPTGAVSTDPGAAPSAPVTAEPQPAVPEPLPTAVLPLDSQAEAATGVAIRVAQLESVEGEAVQAGDVGGPALRVTVEVTNTTTSEADLSAAVVNLYHGAELTPASPLLRPGGRTLPGSVGASQAVTGVYLFSVPAAAREQVRVEVDAQLGGPVVAFEGPAPR
ncbi:hypothetical protein [Cellulomonas fengjieae]|uniref:hypothetical protein n=1 Tax=Cellulomonas fengjieae TaxID=2819978 RepID=UPI001AAF4BE5|nr:hypothetical protein [Cellulomonas fengjieae]MBO3100538.1 hypothetical protein [Cellulomonas fengjieae]